MTLAFEKCCHSEIENGATAKYDDWFFPLGAVPKLKHSPIVNFINILQAAFARYSFAKKYQAKL